MAKGSKKGTVSTNSSYYEYWLEWSSVPNTSTNSSKVTVWHYWKKIGNKYFDSVGARDYGITINGSTDSGSKQMDYSPWVDKNISSYSIDVPHNADGKKSITISTWANGTAGSNGPSSSVSDSNDCKASDTITLDAIPRGATILTAENFNDEGNPIITYSNPAGTAVTSLEACISDNDGATLYADYRPISKDANGSYTFKLEPDEREALLKATRNMKYDSTMYVRFYVRTKIGDYTNHSYLTRKFNVVNSAPSISPKVIDTNDVTRTLTGDNGATLVKYYSNAQFVVNATPKKQGEITSIYVRNGSQTSSSASGTFNSVTSATTTFSVTDSRANNVQQPVTNKWVEYIKLTCNLENERPNISGSMTVRATGQYFNGSFGVTNNELTTQYRYKVSGTNWLNTEDEWKDMTNRMIDSTTYEATASLSGLNYKTTYVFQTRAKDVLNPNGVLSSEKTIKATSIFDWGEKDFRINGDLNVDGNVNITGLLNASVSAILDSIYPVGSIYMNMTDGRNPSEILKFGTWVAIPGRYLLGVGSSTGSCGNTLTIPANKQDGHWYHTHSYAHTHTMPHTHSVGAHSHPLSGNGYAKIYFGGSNFVAKDFNSADWSGNAKKSVSGTASSSAVTGTHAVELGGRTDGNEAFNTGAASSSTTASQSTTTTGSMTTLPPYQSVYMWRRTA